jgi:hypothetical protein
MRTILMAFLDPAEGPWTLPVFFGAWVTAALAVISTGGRYILF